MSIQLISHRICLAAVLAPLLFCATALAAPLNSLLDSKAFDIIPEESHDFFGNLDEQNARAAQENEAIFARGRMAFLFGYHDLARELWLPLANDGYAKAQANLGWMYQTGKGMPKDLKKAVEWYLKAAKQDHVIAKNNLGVMHENGWGTKKNLKRAAYWYREAASTGYSYGQYNFGKMLLEGAGVDKNPKEAAYWLGLAALQGVDEAKGLLINKTKWGTDQIQPAVTKATAPVIPAKQQQVKEILREPWVLSQSAKSYTLQLLSSKEEHVVNDYLNNPAIPDPTAYYKANVLGEDWYSVVYGVFPSFEAAQQHLRILPVGLLRYKPWIRTFADVQRAIKAPVE
ncbi:MAG: SEL1-like repeat protein [Gammaproteobacteria bacterium]|nr:SEL1-like repeat protein [Gammaproteobacteria bacterium]